MEDVRIRRFLSPGSGYGYGDGSVYGYGDGSGYGYGDGSGSGSGYGSGDGSGSGSGYGDGDGSGSGSGYGSGDGSGSGSGSGYGSGLISINGEKIYTVDGVQTIIRQVKGNVAKGCVVKNDLTLLPCFIVKQDGVFAHGENLHKAMEALREKLFMEMSEEERIEAFWGEHKPRIKYPCTDLYEWHHKLTGSCELGRKQFAEDHGIDIDKDEMTVEEFIELTKDAYGGETIRKLADVMEQ